MTHRGTLRGQSLAAGSGTGRSPSWRTSRRSSSPGHLSATRDGRLAVLVNAPDSYFNIPAVLDPASGKLEPIRLDYAGDLFNPSWTSDGKLLATDVPWQSALWRFRPTAKGGQTPP